MILLLSDDLMDASKAIANGRAAGIPVQQVRTVAMLLDRIRAEAPACCILDLQFPGLDLVGFAAAVAKGGEKPRLIAYGSHVNHARLRAARQENFDEALPRSEFFESLPERIRVWAV